jgi:predicted small lipoprotein YifL
LRGRSGPLACVTLSIAFALAACGQTGPLYLPDDGAVEATPPSANTVDDDTATDDETRSR